MLHFLIKRTTFLLLNDHEDHETDGVVFLELPPEILKYNNSNCVDPYGWCI